MPTYQYACTECAHDFEQFQSFSDDALTECPQCSGRLRKLFNAVGVVFKGSGFYRNDSRATTSSEADSGSGSTEKKTDAKPDGTSESKSESKKDAPKDNKPAKASDGSSSGSTPKASTSS